MKEVLFSLDYYPKFGWFVVVCKRESRMRENEFFFFSVVCHHWVWLWSLPRRQTNQRSAVYRENTGTGNCIITWDMIKEQESLSKREIKHIAPKNKRINQRQLELFLVDLLHFWIFFVFFLICNLEMSRKENEFLLFLKNWWNIPKKQTLEYTSLYLNFQVHPSWNNCIANTRNFSWLKNPFTDTNNKNWPGVPLNFVFVSPFFSPPNITGVAALN